MRNICLAHHPDVAHADVILIPHTTSWTQLVSLHLTSTSQALCILEKLAPYMSHQQCSSSKCMLAEWKQRASLNTGVHAATYLLQVMLHLWILHLGDPAIVSQLHSDDCNSIQLVDVVKLLVSPPLLRYQSLGTYSKQHHMSNRRKADQNTCMAQYHSTGQKYLHMAAAICS